MTGYALAVFPRSNDPIPVAEHVELNVEQVIGIIAGDLHVTHDKASVHYFVGCELVVGQLTEHVAKRTGELVGKQRSAACAGQAQLLTFDFDQLAAAEANSVLAGLRSLNCACLTYSSYSHGSPNKVGKNFRVVIFLSAPVDGQEYTALWTELNAQVFSRLADSTSSRVYQQQGIWASHPDWKHKAFKSVRRGEPLEVGRWMRESNADVHANQGEASVFSLTDVQVRRVRGALRWIDMSDYGHWMTTGTALNAMDGDVFEPDWVDRSDPSDDARNDPQRVWDGLKPVMPAEVAFRTILKMAKNGATAVVNKSRGLKEFTPEGRDAAIYLQQNHPHHWRELYVDGGH